MLVAFTVIHLFYLRVFARVVIYVVSGCMVCRTALGSRRVIELVNRQMLFWACSVNKPEGYRGNSILLTLTACTLVLLLLLLFFLNNHPPYRVNPGFSECLRSIMAYMPESDAISQCQISDCDFWQQLFLT